MSEPTERHRVVSTGNKRSAQRVLRVVKDAALDAGCTPDVASDIARRAAQGFLDEGFIVTAQLGGRR